MPPYRDRRRSGPVPGKGRAWLDFQNDVTVKDVRPGRAGELSARSSI